MDTSRKRKQVIRLKRSLMWFYVSKACKTKSYFMHDGSPDLISQIPHWHMQWWGLHATSLHAYFSMEEFALCNAMLLLPPSIPPGICMKSITGLLNADIDYSACSSSGSSNVQGLLCFSQRGVLKEGMSAFLHRFVTAFHKCVLRLEVINHFPAVVARDRRWGGDDEVMTIISSSCLLCDLCDVCRAVLTLHRLVGLYTLLHDQSLAWSNAYLLFYSLIYPAYQSIDWSSNRVIHKPTSQSKSRLIYHFPLYQIYKSIG